MADQLAPTLALRNGAAIPVIGLGTWPLRGAESAAQVRTAIESGYRLIDTAENYRNEDGVGQGIRDSGIDRSEIFLTTKFNREWHSVDGVRTGVRGQPASGSASTTSTCCWCTGPIPTRIATSTRCAGCRRCWTTGDYAPSAPRTSSRPISSGCSTRPASSPT